MKHIESRLWAFVLLTLSLVLPVAVWAQGGHQLTVTAKPAMAGTFNTNSATLVAGETIHLYAYANSNFTFIHWTDEKGAVVSEQMDFTYVMPARDVQLTAEYEYNPANPANPASNYWNRQLGEVIVDDFTTGSLLTAIRSAIGDSNANEVIMITVAGVMNSNDFGIVNTYSGCTLLDLSRVTGISAVPSYAFDYTKLESVYLPATIESIGYRAFYECKQLSSLTVYAMTPPTLDNNVFSGVPDGLVVYVPAAAIAQYQEANGWKDFTLLPIQEDIRSITVSLPNGANASDYAQMWLELTNTKSGQRMHYVLTDRKQYTFSNIIRNTSWNIVLRNERGDVFGKIDNVEVKDEDIAVTFASLSKPQNVTLTVLSPDNTNVTGQVQVTWTDASGNYLAQGTSLTALPVGYQVNYRIALSQELAMMYDTPSAADYTLKNGGNALTCQLQAIGKVQLSGKVKDATTGLPLSGAIVSASQTFGGKYGKTLNAKTDGNGEFTMEVYDVPTSVAIAATDYITQTVHFDHGLNGFDGLEDVLLKPITGATISIDFTYTTVDGETQSWYSDYQNVGYEVFNVSQNRAISQLSVQYPQIVLLEEVEDGDVLRLTATSRTTNYTNPTNVGAFMPVTTTVTIAEQQASATFAITELGRIQATFAQNANASVVGSLYDGAGKLLKTFNYANASLTISDLADGNYTLVTMGSSRLFNTIYDLAQMPQTGLVEGKDYVKNTVQVQSGAISQIVIAEVPTLNESKLYYTGENTSFTVNKPSIVVGNYLTLTGHIDFKPAYATNVSNVQMIVDLPESCQFVENSVMVGNSTSSYVLNGNRITIPMARYTDRVRFCIIPTLGGEYAPSAFVQFDLNGKTVAQPIGSANYTAKDLSISVPSTVAKTAVPVSGTAIGASNIEIYDNDVLIGQTTSLANGTWATTCELNEPYNLSRHKIYAKITTKLGIVLKSDIKDCMYDMNYIEAKTVIMSFYNGWLHKNIQVVFDLQNKRIDQSSYMFYNTTDISFVADLTNNDTTVVKNVTIRVFTDKNNWRNLIANYDSRIDRWIAVSKFSSNELPVGVKVRIDANSELLLDDNTLESYYGFAKDDISDYNNYVEECDSLINYINTQLSLGTSIDVEKIMNDYYNVLGFVNTNEENEIIEHYNYLESLTEEALLEYIDGVIAELDSDYEELMSSKDIFSIEELTNEVIYGEINLEEEGFFDVKTEHIADVTESELLSQGFAELKTVGGNKVYYFVEGSKVDMYDFSNDIHISYSSAEIVGMVRSLSVGKRALDVNEWRTIITSATNIVNAIEKEYHKIKELIDRAIKLNNEAIDFLKKQSKKAGKEINPLAELYKKHGFPSIGDRLAKLNHRIGVFQKGIKNLNANSKLLTGLKVVGKSLTRGLNIAAILIDGYSAIDDMNQWYELGLDLKARVEKCENYRNLYDQAQTKGYSILIGYVSLLTLDITSVLSVKRALTPPNPWLLGFSIGSSLASAVGGIFIPRNSANYKREIMAEIPNVPKCKDYGGDDGNNRNNNDEGEYENDKPSPEITPIRDPSGYVYEGVFSNRVEGTTATVFYKELIEDIYGDLYENVVKWDAEEYAQENPLFTDENGYYRWDVPQGLWQVKFEKEGYETTYSE